MITLIGPNPHVHPNYSFYTTLKQQLESNGADWEEADMDWRMFPDGEIYTKSNDNIRGKDVFIVHTGANNPNTSLMSLLITIDACRRASADRITAVIPYFMYARQDRKDSGREPITAKLVAMMLETAGADRVLTMELHAGQIQGFFHIPCDNLISKPVFSGIVDDLIEDPKDWVIMSPDAGGDKRAFKWSDFTGAGCAIQNKHRKSATRVEALALVGDVDQKHVLVVDDMTATSGTIVMAVENAIAHGALSVHGVVAHAPMNAKGEKRIDDSPIIKLFITDSTTDADNIKTDKVQVCSAAPLFAKSIQAISENTSVSSLL